MEPGSSHGDQCILLYPAGTRAAICASTSPDPCFMSARELDLWNRTWCDIRYCDATLDTLGGFIVGHQRTIPEAFINSGPFGGIMDLFLFLCGLLLGVPILSAHYAFTTADVVPGHSGLSAFGHMQAHGRRRKFPGNDR